MEERGAAPSLPNHRGNCRVVPDAHRVDDNAENPAPVAVLAVLFVRGRHLLDVVEKHACKVLFDPAPVHIVLVVIAVVLRARPRAGDVLSYIFYNI